MDGLVFNRQGKSAGILENSQQGHAFLVCGGPSIDDTDLSVLQRRGLFVAAVNCVAGTHVRPHMAVMYDTPHEFAESLWNDPGVAKFTHIMHWEKPVREGGAIAKHCPNVWFYHSLPDPCRAENFFRCPYVSVRLREPESRTKSVMMPAFRLLYWLGFRDVYLLGADFRMEGEKHYAGGRCQPAERVPTCNTNYGVQRNWFRDLRRVGEPLGFRVYNCTPGSAITELPTLDLEDAIERAIAEHGGAGCPHTGLGSSLLVAGDVSAV